MEVNYLKAVFWDYPKFADKDYILSIINDNNHFLKNWLLRRFLEYGRAVDTLGFFNINQIEGAMHSLRLRPFTRKKWNRLIEVYSHKDRFSGYKGE